MSRAAMALRAGVVLSASVLAAVGLFAIASADRTSSELAARQAIWLLIGVGLAALAARGRAWLLSRSIAVHAGACALVALSLLSSLEHHGAHRWLRLGPITVAPLPFATLTLVLALSRALAPATAEQGDGARTHRTALAWLALLGAVLAPAVLQPDRVGALIAVLVSLALVYAVPMRHEGRAVIETCIAIGLVVLALTLPPHHEARWDAFVRRDDPQGAGWWTERMGELVEAGGLFGRGSGSLLEHHARIGGAIDQGVLGVVAYEGGLVATVATLGASLSLVLCLLALARRASEPRDGLLAIGVAMLFAIPTLLHAGAVLGVLPPLGVGMPLVSYGGSAVVALLIGLGLATRDPATEDRRNGSVAS